MKKMLALMFFIVLPINAFAGSVWEEDKTDFQNGETKDTTITSEGISLSFNSTIYTSWINITPEKSPCGRRYIEMTYSKKHDLFMVYGGVIRGASGAEITNDTWLLSNDTWRKSSASMPHRLSGYAIAYDEKRDVALLFGGMDENTAYCETWTYNFTTDKWTKVNTISTPPARGYSAMVYDSDNDVFILFGGLSGLNRLNDTWVYQPGIKRWKNIITPTSPPPTAIHCMAYDKENKVVVMFGGSTPSGLSNKTWIYNTTTKTWKKSSSKTAPSERYSMKMVYDEKNREIVLFGGTYYPSDMYNDTWAYSTKNDSWYKKKTEGYVKGTHSHGMSYRSRNGEIYIFGGGRFSNETWKYHAKMFVNKGIYTSKYHDCCGSAYFGKIYIDADLEKNTSIKIHIRSAERLDNLNDSKFVGPDGTENSYYSSGDWISNIHNGSRWMQYRAYLETSDATTSPILKKVKINYNLIHSINIKSPTGGETFTDNFTIEWEANDLDNDSLYFDIYLIGNKSITLAKNISSSSLKVYIKDIEQGNYRIKIVAKDDNEEIPLSVKIETKNITIIKKNETTNHPPEVVLTSPKNNQTIKNSSVLLQWEGKDKDGDKLYYYLYLDSSNAETLVGFTNKTYYLAENLKNNKTYYWKVIPYDGKINGTSSEIWSFRVIYEPEKENTPPYVLLRHPKNNTIINSTFISFLWDGYDEDGDILTYYLKISNDSEEIIITTNKSSYNMNLSIGNYFWTVIPNDGKVNGTSLNGTWKFTIMEKNDTTINHPPIASLIAPLNNSKVDDDVVLTWKGEDMDGDELIYYVLVSKKLEDILKGKYYAMTRSTTYIINNLERGTYYWSIIPNDGKVNGSCNNIWKFIVEIKKVGKIKCKIIKPSEGFIATNEIEIIGTVIGGEKVVRVEVRIDEEAWKIIGNERNWTYKIDTTKLKNGKHTLYARAFDGEVYSNIASVNITVNNPIKKGSDEKVLHTYYLIIIPSIILIAIMSIYLAHKKKKKHKIEKETPKKEEKIYVEEETISKEEDIPLFPEEIEEVKDIEEGEDVEIRGVEVEDVEESEGEEDIQVKEEKKDAEEEHEEKEKLDEAIEKLIGDKDKKKEDVEESLDELLKKLKS